MAQMSANKCDICKEDIGKVFCYECNHFLCKSCNSWHEKFPATKRHTITDSHNVDRSTLMLKLVCTDHDLQFAYYCRDCGCLICAQCVTSLHMGHSITDVVNITAESRETVKKRHTMIQKNIKILENLIEAFKTTKQKKLQTDTDTFIKEVREVSQDLTNIIETATEIKSTQASDFHALEKQALLYSLAKLEKSYSENNSLHERFKQVLNEKHDVSFFLIQESLMKEFELLDEISIPEEPNEMEKFKRDDFVDSIVNTMDSRYNRGMKQEQEKSNALKEELQKKESEIFDLKDKIEMEKHMLLGHFQETIQNKEKEIHRLNNNLQHVNQQVQQYAEQKEEEMKRLQVELQRKENTIAKLLKQCQEENASKENERKQKA